MNIIIIFFYFLFFWPRYSIPREWKNYVMQYKKVQKLSWNEPYSSSSFTYQNLIIIIIIIIIIIVIVTKFI